MIGKLDKKSLMPPLWLIYPQIPAHSIGWRMGYGESYAYDFANYFESLSEEQRTEYKKLFPEPIVWQGFYEPKQLFEHRQKYSVKSILNTKKSNILLFYSAKANKLMDKACLSQWFKSDFYAGRKFINMEQYMMASKAALFQDEEFEKLIIEAKDPKTIKALGRKVRNFDQTVWDKNKYRIVFEGNYYKFTQNPELFVYLIKTKDKVLAEASPTDTVWGIGYSSDNDFAKVPSKWRGENLLGFALMEVRDDIKKIYANYNLIDWHNIYRKYCNADE